MLIGWDRGHFSFILEIAPDNDQHLENIKKRPNFALTFYNFIDGKCFWAGLLLSFIQSYWNIFSLKWNLIKDVAKTTSVKL